MKELVRVEHLFKSYGNGTKQIEVLKESISPFPRPSGWRIVGASGVGKDHPAPHHGNPGSTDLREWCSMRGGMSSP